MIDLPSSATSAPAKAAPVTAPRTPDSPNETKEAQAEDGLFHEELTREMGALQNQAQTAKDARDSAEAATSGKTKDKGDDSAQQTGATDASLAAMLNGAVSPPALPVDTKSLPVAVETAIADASASMSASATAAAPAAAAIAGAESPRGARPKWSARTDNDTDRAASLWKSAEPNPNGLERESETSRAESGLAASAKLAESAAFGKFLPAGHDTAEVRVGSDAGLLQRHGAETSTQIGMNAVPNAPAQGANHATSAAIATHVAAPGWDRGLGEKMVWMAGQQVQVAELHLNPPELGPLQVTLTISNDQASAQFVSQHAAVREAIETAMPRLREMLAEGGITLGNASVSADSFHDQAQAQHDSRSYARQGALQMDSGGAFQLSPALRATRGLVDIFA